MLTPKQMEVGPGSLIDVQTSNNNGVVCVCVFVFNMYKICILLIAITLFLCVAGKSHLVSTVGFHLLSSFVSFAMLDLFPCCCWIIFGRNIGFKKVDNVDSLPNVYLHNLRYFSLSFSSILSKVKYYIFTLCSHCCFVQSNRKFLRRSWFKAMLVNWDS